jgi:hypothetical protein
MTWQEFSAALQTLAQKMPTTAPNPLDEKLLHVRHAMDEALGKAKANARYESLAADITVKHFPALAARIKGGT